MEIFYNLIKNHSIFFTFFLCIFNLINNCYAATYTNGDFTEMEFRVVVDGGKKECFYQLVKVNQTLEISYSIVETSSRFSSFLAPSGEDDMRMDFKLKNQHGEELFYDESERYATHVHQSEEEGVYEMCFDNEGHFATTKQVNIEIYLYRDDDDEDRWGYEDVHFEPESEHLEILDGLKKQLNKVRDSMIQIEHLQYIKRAHEKRDLNLSKAIYGFINYYSMFSIFVLLAIGFAQVAIIRSFFENKSVLHVLFRPLIRSSY